MDIALPADRRGVAESPGHLADSLSEVTPRVPRLASARPGRQGVGGQDRAPPRPEIFRCEVASTDVPQVSVDVRRVDHLPLPISVDILKQLVPRQLLASTDHARQSTVRESDGMALAPLAAELEPQARAVHGDVLGAEGGQPIRMVLPDVLRVTDPDQRRLEQAEDRGEHLFSGQTRPELDEPGVLGLVPDITPSRMIPVLLAAAGIAPYCLNVPVRDRADPYSCPRRRDGKSADATKGRQVPQSLAFRAEIVKRLATAD